MVQLIEKIILPEHSDALYAPELHKLLLESLETGNSVEIDASGVEKLSALNIQLILSALKSYQQKNLTVRCVNASVRFKEACELILGDYLKYFKE